VLVLDPPNPFLHQAKTTQRVLTVSYELPAVVGHKLNLSVFNHDEKLVQRTADLFQGQVFYTNSDAENQRLGLRSTASRSYALAGGELETTFGVDWLRQRYYRPQVDPASGRVTGFISPEVKLQSTAVFFQPQFRTGPWLLTGGVRHERFRGEVGSEGFDPAIRNASTPGEIPDFSLTLFNAGAVYDITGNLQVFAGFSQGAEISEFGRAARGARNPALINLEGAKSDQVEAGLRGRAGSAEFTTAVFHSRSDKAANLQADPSCAGQPLCPLIPLRRAQKIHGVEATADWRVNPNWLLGTLATYQKGKFTEPGATPVPFGTDTLSPPRVTLYGEYRPAPQWKLRLQGTYFGATNEYDAVQEAAGFRNTDSVFLADFAASYQWGPSRLTLAIANLFNRRYVNVTNQASGDFFYYLSEGRRVSLTYEARF
jgi:iron complex outermembrane receptor protein